VLLVPEFDIPSHTSSWGAGVPEMMVQCGKQFTHGDTMNPTVNITFNILDKFLGEMAALFPKPFLHLGGDEVPTTCWMGNATVTDWMAKHGMSTADELESYFVNKVAALQSVKESGRA
jgi:hexosaminidase